VVKVFAPAVLATAETREPGGEVVHRAPVDIAMEQYAAGDDSAFAVVYDGLAPRLYGYFLRHSHDASLSEDLVQQTMLHMHRARGRFIVGAAVTPWSFAIARRLLVDAIRRAKRERGRAADDSGPAQLTDLMADDYVGLHELTERIHKVLSRLPASQRIAFELVKGEGLTMAEAAESLGTTVAAVKLRAHRACVSLRLELGLAIFAVEGDA
jgi:RNA polymerase sigma-70 factor (ECF subfamily)